MTYVHALIEDPKLSFLKTTFLRTNNEGKLATCSFCNKKIHIKDTPQHPIIDVFCSKACYASGHEFLPFPTESIVSRPNSYKAVNAEKCSECGGKRRGKGWAHNEGCSLDTRPRGPKSFCPECQGGARGRGYIHYDNCPKKLRKINEKVVIKRN